MYPFSKSEVMIFLLQSLSDLLNVSLMVFILYICKDVACNVLTEFFGK
jgi:hypothetical protein